MKLSTDPKIARLQIIKAQIQALMAEIREREEYRRALAATTRREVTASW